MIICNEVYVHAQNEYALKQAQVLVNLCEMVGMDWKQWVMIM